MNSKAILGIIAAITIVVTVVPAMAQDITTINDSTSTQQGNSVKTSVTVTDDIKANAAEYFDDPENLVFGYGWVDGDTTGSGVVVVLHPTFRDSTQNPDSWHTHPVTLGAGNLYAFCIDSIGQGTEGSQAGISFGDSDKTDGIKNNRISLSVSSKQIGVSASELDTVASFTVKSDGACPTDLGVDVIDATAI